MSEPSESAAGPRTEAIRLRDGLVVVLALTTGSVDATAYLRLGKVFSSVITGNLALLGIPGKDQPAWPRRVTVTLAAELLVLAGFSGGWLAAGGHPSGGPRLALLAVTAAAMGMQATAVRRLGPTMSTTCLTSTLTGLCRRWRSVAGRRTGSAAPGYCRPSPSAPRSAGLPPCGLRLPSRPRSWAPLATVLACSFPVTGPGEPGGHPSAALLCGTRGLAGGTRRQPPPRAPGVVALKCDSRFALRQYHRRADPPWSSRCPACASRGLAFGSPPRPEPATALHYIAALIHGRRTCR